MARTSGSAATPLQEQLDRLAAFDPVELPVISLYLDMQPDQHGRDRYDAFLRKTLAERLRSYRSGDAARDSFEADAAAIREFLGEQLERSANGLAIFACHGAGLFETIQMTAPIDQHWLFVGSVPHLYPLARVNDQYPRYAALLVDTNAARLFVFSLGATESREEVRSVKTRRTSMGGWSQARYQRHVEHYHAQHMKEVVEVLERVVREDRIDRIVLSCDEVARPLLMEHLPRHLADRIVDVVPLDMKAAEHEVLRETLEILRTRDAQTDEEQVEAMLGAWRAGGLAVAGTEETLRALEMGQVDELIIAARTDAVRPAAGPGAAPAQIEVETSAPNTDRTGLTAADELVTKAQATGARIRFVEQADLLEAVGGVGALLRFRI